DEVEDVVREDRRGTRRHLWQVVPGNVVGSHIAVAAGPDRDQLFSARRGREKYQAVPEYGPQRGVHAAVDHPPKLFAGHRVVRDGGFRGRRDQLVAAVDGDDAGRAVRFLQVAVVLLVLKIAVGLPGGLARVLVQGDDVLQVIAVVGHDQQVLVNDRRRAGAAPVVARQVTAFPDRLRCGR